MMKNNMISKIEKIIGVILPNDFESGSKNHMKYFNNNNIQYSVICDVDDDCVTKFHISFIANVILEIVDDLSMKELKKQFADIKKLYNDHLIRRKTQYLIEESDYFKLELTKKVSEYEEMLNTIDNLEKMLAPLLDRKTKLKSFLNENY